MIPSSVPFYDREIVDLAALVMIQCILTSGESAHLVMDSVASISEAEMVYILADVSRLWLECAFAGIPSDLDAMELQRLLPTQLNTFSHRS